jgi:hypothetical protein
VEERIGGGAVVVFCETGCPRNAVAAALGLPPLVYVRVRRVRRRKRDG